MNFENALRKKYRFPSIVGDLTIEQLWDLPLQSTRANRADLNSVAKEINRSLKTQIEESFVETSNNPLKAELEEKLEIVKHVIAVQKAENEAERTVAEKKAKKAELLELLHDKRKEELKGKSTAEIEAMIEAL